MYDHTLDELFEEVDKAYTNPIQSYDKKSMLDNWLANQNYQLRILPSSVFGLFCKLDEELLIGRSYTGENFNEWNSSEHISGIFGDFNNIYVGSGERLEYGMV